MISSDNYFPKETKGTDISPIKVRKLRKEDVATVNEIVQAWLEGLSDAIKNPEKEKASLMIDSHNVLSILKCAINQPSITEKKHKEFFSALHQKAACSALHMQSESFQAPTSSRLQIVLKI